MNRQYIEFGKKLKILLAGAKLVTLQKPGCHESVFVQDEAFIPLEDSAYPAGTSFITLAHYISAPEGGKDTPKILFECREIEGKFHAAPIAYLHERLDITQNVHERDEKGNILKTDKLLEKQITAYADTLFLTLRTQGYFNGSAIRKRLE